MKKTNFIVALICVFFFHLVRSTYEIVARNNKPPHHHLKLFNRVRGFFFQIQVRSMLLEQINPLTFGKNILMLIIIEILNL